MPRQMCQFHMQQIVTKYITKKPLLPENQSLKAIADTLTYTDRDSFTHWLESWYSSNRAWLSEKRYNHFTGKNEFIHKRTRSAYGSLKRFLPYLFTHIDVLPDLDIPNTTNSIESTFSHLKDKLRVHR